MTNLIFLILETDLCSQHQISLNQDVFLEMTSLRLVVTDQYKLCCFLPEQSTCSISLPWYASCDNLLPNFSLKVLFQTFSIKMLVLNTVSICLQILSYKLKLQKNASNGMLVGFVNLSDIFCALPLLIVWIFDLIYLEMFIIHEFNWRSSGPCYVVFSQFLMFSISSPVSLCFLSYHRLEMVKNPVNTSYKRTSFIVKRCGKIIASSASLSILLTCFTWLNAHILGAALPTSLCSPFVDPSQELIIVTIILGLITIYQMASIVYILTCYIFLMISLQKSAESLKDAVNKRTSHATLITQIVLVSLSNILCWIPSFTSNIVAAALKNYSSQIILWTTVLVFPLNSVVNPVIFCVVSLRKMCKYCCS